MNASELISNPKDRTELVIYRGTIEAGVLRRIENGCSFVFSRKFLQNSKYSDLSFRMPKSARPLITYGINLPPFFAGLLPEGLRLKVLLKKIKTSDDDLFSLFAAAGRNVAGDVYAKTDIDSSLTRPAPKLNDVDFFELFRQSLHEFETAFGNETLAGVQEKISAAMISFPINIAKASKSYILKLNPKETPSLVQNELICLNLARRCGIEIPKFKIIKDKNNNPGLLVERFDRIWNAEKKTFHLLHQEDACQFLQRYPADKYQLSVNDIVNGMQEIATAPTASVLKFLRLYCFSYLIGNGDMHAKNISLYTLFDRKMTDLTPAYDLVSTHVYGDQQMALKLDGKKDNLSRKLICDFGKRFGVNEKATSKMLTRLCQKVRENTTLLDFIPVEARRLEHLKKTVLKRLDDLEK